MRHGQEKEHLLMLTSAVYRVTALFPVGEELGRKIRDLADKIREENISLHIEEILRLFDEAEKKNWVDPRNFLVLKREYEVLFGFRHRTHVFGVGNRTNMTDSNTNRQEKILAVMAGNGTVKIGDLVKMFPGINRRTVLRDLEVLCQTGVMVRNGIGRGAFYVKNGHTNATLSQ